MRAARLLGEKVRALREDRGLTQEDLVAVQNAIQELAADLTADAATSGYMDVADQIEGGRLRALALTAPQRFAGSNIPTARELGYDVTLANWRAIVAPPGITDEEFETLRQVVHETVQTPEWHDAIARNQWTDVYLDGPQFEQWFGEEEARIGELVGRMNK